MTKAALTASKREARHRVKEYPREVWEESLIVLLSFRHSLFRGRLMQSRDRAVGWTKD
jgi:hypothetical protein